MRCHSHKYKWCIHIYDLIDSQYSYPSPTIHDHKTQGRITRFHNWNGYIPIIVVLKRIHFLCLSNCNCTGHSHAASFHCSIWILSIWFNSFYFIMRIIHLTESHSQCDFDMFWLLKKVSLSDDWHADDNHYTHS